MPRARSKKVSTRNLVAYLILGGLLLSTIDLLNQEGGSEIFQASWSWPTSQQSVANPSPNKEEFIQSIASATTTLKENHDFIPSVVIAQAILESDFGQSQLSRDYNNLFGRKTTWGYGVNLPTQEFVNGKYITVTEPFKVYNSWAESVEDHLYLMERGVDWDQNLYQPVLQAKTYKEAVYALAKAGYATDPAYAEKLIQVIEHYQLTQYD